MFFGLKDSAGICTYGSSRRLFLLFKVLNWRNYLREDKMLRENCVEKLSDFTQTFEVNS